MLYLTLLTIVFLYANLQIRIVYLYLYFIAK